MTLFSVRQRVETVSVSYLLNSIDLLSNCELFALIISIIHYHLQKPLLLLLGSFSPYVRCIGNCTVLRALSLYEHGQVLLSKL